MQLLAKGYSILQKYRTSGQYNPWYSSKTIKKHIGKQNKTKTNIGASCKRFTILYIWGSMHILIRNSVCVPTVCGFVIATRTTHQRILKNLDRGNASMIYWLLFLKHQLSLDPSKIRGQANDGAPAVSSEKAGVQARRNYSISIVFPLLFPTVSIFQLHCPAHFGKIQTSLLSSMSLSFSF